ncbi:hypothetical protein ACJMK2_034632 [Sinanodonta woodiana]|uniref:Major facilitator superfamily (MFS) profile domain-containing protein n=1 Tax=Sinanodonta woodiana TaxID=1069815 RepID=A0ABD3WVS0_SINWO
MDPDKELDCSQDVDTSTDLSYNNTRKFSMTIIDKEKPFKMYTEERKDSSDDEVQLVKEVPDVLKKREVFLLNIAWFGLSLMFLLLSVEVVPAQIQSLVGPAVKGRWLGGMVAVGAALTFFTSPIIGMQSDRSRFRVGKRRPVMLIGTIGLCIGLIGMALSAPEIDMHTSSHGKVTKNSSGTCVTDLVAQRCRPYWNRSDHNPLQAIQAEQHPVSIIDTKLVDGFEVTRKETQGSIAMYIIFYLIVTTAFASIAVPYNALIADKSHPTQRGLNSGVMAAMILLGNVSGALVGTTFTQVGVLGSYAISIVTVIVTLLITVCTIAETPGKPNVEPIGCLMLFCGFWQPLKEHDFRWVFITRFLMQQGVSTVTGFLEYWLNDMIYLPNCWTAATSVAVMLLPLLFAAAMSSIVVGFISDRCGRRKPFVIAAALLMSGSITGLTFIEGHLAYYFAVGMAFLFGIGFGSFQSVDFALVMDVLPEEKEKAKDIAVWHQALILPNALATPVGGLILDFFESVKCEIGLGYIVLFVVTAVYFLVSGIFVLNIRRAR